MVAPFVLRLLCVLSMLTPAAHAFSAPVASSSSSSTTRTVSPPATSPPRPEDDTSPTGAVAGSSGGVTANGGERRTRRTSVVICPAQFCVPADYQDLIRKLQERNVASSDDNDGTEVGTCRVAPLPRTEWIKVARSLPTKSFLDANLKARSTLGWYFDAIESALAEIYAEEGSDVNVCLVGHSIGGWVARAYLGGLSRSNTAVHELTQKRCSSLVTLGTPHSYPTGALVDQTRGLLREVKEAQSCSSQSLAGRGIQVTCVGSSGVCGKIVTSNVEELVAATSYIPLLGKLSQEVTGDGIVPTDLAFMEEPARRVVIEESRCGQAVRHAHVFPTPWNLIDGSAASITLPDDFMWYGSDSVLDDWARFIR